MIAVKPKFQIIIIVGRGRYLGSTWPKQAINWAFVPLILAS